MKEINEVFLTNAADIGEANLIEAILKTNSIPMRRVEAGAGEYLNIYMGMSNTGVDIFVLEKDLAQAKELTKVKEIPKQNKDSKKSILRRRGALFILLLITIPLIIKLLASTTDFVKWIITQF